jgi:hypothetical protein
LGAYAQQRGPSLRRLQHRENTNTLSSLVGLTVAFGGVAPLVSPAAQVLGKSQRLATMLLGQGVLWLIFAIIVAIVTVWEGTAWSRLTVLKAGAGASRNNIVLRGTPRRIAKTRHTPRSCR